MNKPEESCACARCANSACGCRGKSAEAGNAACCCGPACRCGEACKCAPSCGCASAT